MLKVFISQPMRNKTNEQIKAERQRAVENIRKKYGIEDVEIIDSFIENAPHNAAPLWFLGESIKLLGTANIAYFIGDWRNYRGCRVEHAAAVEYGIKTMEE